MANGREARCQHSGRTCHRHQGAGALEKHACCAVLAPTAGAGATAAAPARDDAKSAPHSRHQPSSGARSCHADLHSAAGGKRPRQHERCGGCNSVSHSRHASAFFAAGHGVSSC
eukprot:3821132-Amphidinium_carterae.1